MEHEAKQRVQPQKNPQEERSDLATQHQNKTHNNPKNDSFIKISTRYNRSMEVTALPFSIDY
jgi:hypothetical protein